MKQIKYFIAAITVLIAFICTLYNSCIDSYDLDKTKEFVNKQQLDFYYKIYKS